MVGDIQSSVKYASHLLTKIEVMKFDGTNNFKIWRCEVMDTLMVSNLEEPEDISEKDWEKMNRMACGVIRSYLTQDIKYHVLYETSARKIWEILPDEEHRSRLHLKRKLYHFQLNRVFSIDEHMNNYTKFLSDLINVNVEIEEEDKAVILLNSLPDEEYETYPKLDQQ